MRAVYGYEGFGWFWAFIEMLREDEDHKLSLAGKYVYQGFAKELQTTPEKIKTFIQDCINEFHLFSGDDKSLWSDSLNRRIELYEATRQRYAIAGEKGAAKRWGMKLINDDVIATPQINNNIATENDSIKGKEIKVNKTKEKEIVVVDVFKLYQENIEKITPLIAEHLKDAIETYGEDKLREAIKIAANANRRFWSYVQGTLEKIDKPFKRNGQISDDPDKFIKGKYGHIVQR
jgi:DnaD/phage-associated family protein